MDLKYLGAHNILREHKGRQTHWISLIFLAKVNPKDVRVGEPEYIDDIGWFSMDNLPSPMHSQFARFSAMIRKELTG